MSDYHVSSGCGDYPTNECSDATVTKICWKGQGTKEKGFSDRCYFYYNGECIRGKGQFCLYGIKK